MPKYGNLTTSKSWTQISNDIQETFRKWNVTQYELPYKDDSVRRRTVTVTATMRGQEQQITCDRFQDGNAPERNYMAIALALDALRLADARGIADVFAQAAKFAALPDPNNPYHILSINPDSSGDEIARAYRLRVRQVHPDQGGSREEFERVRNAARKLGVIEDS